MQRTILWVMLIVLILPNTALFADERKPLFSIDFYGLRTMDEDDLLDSIRVRIGTRGPIDHAAIAKAVKGVNGVADAKVIGVGTGEARFIFVGVREEGAPPPIANARHLPLQTGNALLPDELMTVFLAWEEAHEMTIRLGGGSEDHSQGHALMDYEPGRAAQLQFVGFANSRRSEIEPIIRESKNALHRAAAVMMIAYASDKTEVVDILAYAARDSNSNVRNNAVRALMVIAEYAAVHREKKIDVPAEPFLPFLESTIWTDRNKGAALIAQLTRTPSKELIKTLRRDYLLCIAEMARWRSAGHAGFSVNILQNISGLSADDIKSGSAGIYQSYEKRLAWIDKVLGVIIDRSN